MGLNLLVKKKSGGIKSFSQEKRGGKKSFRQEKRGGIKSSRVYSKSVGLNIWNNLNVYNFKLGSGTCKKVITVAKDTALNSYGHDPTQ